MGGFCHALIVIFSVVLGQTLVAQASKIDSTPEQLKKEATHIVVGKVTEIFSSTAKGKDFAITRFVAQIQIEKLEKGTGLKPGKLVYARYSDMKWLGKTPPPVGAVQSTWPPKRGPHAGTWDKHPSCRGYDKAVPTALRC